MRARARNVEQSRSRLQHLSRENRCRPNVRARNAGQRNRGSRLKSRAVATAATTRGQPATGQSMKGSSSLRQDITQLLLSRAAAGVHRTTCAQGEQRSAAGVNITAWLAVYVAEVGVAHEHPESADPAWWVVVESEVDRLKIFVDQSLPWGVTNRPPA